MLLLPTVRLSISFWFLLFCSWRLAILLFSLSMISLAICPSTSSATWFTRSCILSRISPFNDTTELTESSASPTVVLILPALASNSVSPSEAELCAWFKSSSPLESDQDRMAEKSPAAVLVFWMIVSASSRADAPEAAASSSEPAAFWASEIRSLVESELLLNLSNKSSYAWILASAFFSISLMSVFTLPTASATSVTEFLTTSDTDSAATDENVLLIWDWIVLAPVLVIFGAMALAFSLI